MKRSLILLFLYLLYYNVISLTAADMLFSDIVEKELFTTKILRNDNNQYFVEVSTKDLPLSKVSFSGERFTLINSSDCEFDNLEGNPALPLYNQCVALPTNCNRLKSAIVEELKWDTIQVGRLMPIQPSFLEGEAAKDLVINQDVYERGWYRPEQIKTSGIQIYRCIKNTTVSVCPFNYNALTGQLAVLRNFRLKILFDNNGLSTKSTAIPSHYLPLFNNSINQSSTHQSSSNRDNGSYDYLIIVGNIPDVLGSEVLRDFQLWKALRGIRTKVVTTAITGYTDTSIKSYIQGQYASDNIKYVLFIGKAHHIPQHIMRQFVHTDRILRSDYWYGCMDGENDWEADVAIGRYSVNSLQELENAMRKTIKYEEGTNADGKNVLLVAHQQYAGSSSSFQNCLEGIRNNIQNANFSFIREYGATITNGGTEATCASVVERINQGVGIFNYRGHAGPFFWRDDWCQQSWPHLDSMMVSTFTNDKYPIALSIACETGRIDSTGTCLMDLYMNGVHGISSGIGSTAESWHYENNKFNEYLYRMINSDNDGLGFINIGAHILCASNPDSYYKDNRFGYCCFGDPSLNVWTDSIRQLPIPTIEATSTSFVITINGITDYDIIAASETDGLIATYHSTSSSITIPLPSVSCTIAIHKRNYQSYLFDYIATGFVQNKVISRRTFTSASPIAIGNNVTTEVPVGDVVIENGSVLQIRQASEVSIPNGFECKLGGQLIIK